MWPLCTFWCIEIVSTTFRGGPYLHQEVVPSGLLLKNKNSIYNMILDLEGTRNNTKRSKRGDICMVCNPLSLIWAEIHPSFGWSQTENTIFYRYLKNLNHRRPYVANVTIAVILSQMKSPRPELSQTRIKMWYCWLPEENLQKLPCRPYNSNKKFVPR